mgnify:CR=1 FL=1
MSWPASGQLYHHARWVPGHSGHMPASWRNLLGAAQVGLSFKLICHSAVEPRVTGRTKLARRKRGSYSYHINQTTVTLTRPRWPPHPPGTSSAPHCADCQTIHTDKQLSAKGIEHAFRRPDRLDRPSIGTPEPRCRLRRPTFIG